MKLLPAAILFATTMLTASAYAADDSWYVGASGDVSFPRNTTVTGPTAGKIKYKFSSGGDIALGYEPQMLNSKTGDVRLELEGGYHALGLDSVTAGGTTNTNPKGDLKIATAMANAYYDIHTGTGFTPYIGAGAGDAHITFNKNNGFGMTSSTDNRLGYQFMAGVTYTPESLPKTDWTLGYRYLGTTSPSFNATGGSEKFSALHASNIEIGFRYHF